MQDTISPLQTKPSWAMPYDIALQGNIPPASRLSIIAELQDTLKQNGIIANISVDRKASDYGFDTLKVEIESFKTLTESPATSPNEGDITPITVEDIRRSPDVRALLMDRLIKCARKAESQLSSTIGIDFDEKNNVMFIDTPDYDL